MRHTLALSFVALSLGMALFAGQSHRPKPPQAPRKLSLAFVTNNPSDWWTSARHGVEKAEKELGIKVNYQIPAGGTAEEQNRILSDLLSKGTQGIAVCPVDPSGQTQFLNKIASKARLFTQDSDAPHSKRVCFIGTNELESGRKAGKELKRILPRGGGIMLFVGRKDAPNASARIRGLTQELKKSKLRIIDIRTDDADRTRAKSNVSDALATYPRLVACVGIWSYNGPAILSAVQDARKTGKVRIVCFDEESDTLEGVRKGEIAATIVQQPFQIGYLSIVKLAQSLSGDKSVVPANRRIFTPTRVIRRNNVAPFKKQLDQWRRIG